MEASLTAPMVADPGTTFVYGINADWLGRVVEAAAGVTLDVAIKDGITGPLGMGQTSFGMDDGQRGGSTPVHLKGEDGTWAASDVELNQHPDYWSGGHGLYSTPRDYRRFQRALVRGGELDGTRILREATVEAFANQIGELDFPAEIATADPASAHAYNVGPGRKWGYGLLLNIEDVPGMRRAGSGAWAGSLNTHFWVDRTTASPARSTRTPCRSRHPRPSPSTARYERALYAASQPRPGARR